MNGDAGKAEHDHLIDWLAHSPDLDAVIDRISQLVNRLGYSPEELLILPRSELDQREMSAYSAGWADVVSEHMPAIRLAYEERIMAAYFQGQEDVRTGRQPRRARRFERGRDNGGEVIPLPYLPMLDAPPVMTEVEERGAWEQSVADGSRPPVLDGSGSDLREESEAALEPAAGTEPESDILLWAREVRTKNPGRFRQREPVWRNGRPSVPPLTKPNSMGNGARERGCSQRHADRLRAPENRERE